MECGIVFLDINMDGMDGLETARQIKASRFLLKDDLEQTLQECMDDILREILQEERVVEFGFVDCPCGLQGCKGGSERQRDCCKFGYME